MPGPLAGLFAGHSTSHEAAENSKLPVGHSRPASPSEIHEQLRALSDPDTVLQGQLRCGSPVMQRRSVRSSLKSCLTVSMLQVSAVYA